MSMKSMYGDNSKSYSASVRLKSTLIFIVLVIISLICILPIYFLIINATRNNVQISATGVSFIPGSIESIKNNWELVFNGPIKEIADLKIGFKNSLIVTIPSTIFTIFFSCLTAYGLVVYDYKLKTPAYTFIIAVMMIPATISTTGYAELIREVQSFLTEKTGKEVEIFGNLYWLILPSVAAPAIVFFMRQYMKSTFPLDLVEAARIDGSNEFRTFLTIAMPIMKPAVAIQAIFAFVSKWNDLYSPSILLAGRNDKQTLPFVVSLISGAQKQFADYKSAAWLAIAISILPMIIVYIILSKFIIAGVTAGGVKE